MKDRVWILDFNSPFRVRRYTPILLDASALMGVARGYEWFQDIDQLMRSWRRLQISSVAFVTDFVKLEALNAERWHFKTSRVRYFLKEVEKSADGFYVEVRTPIRQAMAGKRGQYLNLLSKSDRHVLLKDYPELSGTDICMLAVAVYLHNSGIEVSLASSDQKLIEASKALYITTFNKMPKLRT